MTYLLVSVSSRALYTNYIAPAITPSCGLPYCLLVCLNVPAKVQIQALRAKLSSKHFEAAMFDEYVCVHMCQELFMYVHIVAPLAYIYIYTC